MKVIKWIYKYRIKKKLPGLKKYKIGKLLECQGGKHIIFGDNFKAGIMFRMEAIDEYSGIKYNPVIEIGDNVDFGQNCHIGCINHILIGNNVLVGSKVLIIDHDHGDSFYQSDVPPGKRKLVSKGPIRIGDNVWICDGVAILGNVVVGDNVIIGANSVITKDIPSNVVVAGAPAKVIRELKNK